ncbi:MAG: MsnO8 family LLM class oxidoreductase [Alphaproteobacteria bacterium]|nr:MsnO8 family LLM class oxidoreductase [Alphaproteobacteria bacterium]
MMLKLSVLDQSPIRKDGTAADAVHETIALAKACEEFGYNRYWLAEHHNTTSFAGSTPEVLIARVAAETKRMRIGSGGIMLPHYSPLKVAENFRMLETLYPERIDLAVGRAPGSDQRTAVALQAGPQPWDIETFPQQVALLRHYLEESAGLAQWPADHPYRTVHASPRGPGVPEMWMLASSMSGAVFAAELGLPLSFAHFISPEGGLDAVALYRSRFKPRTPDARPRVAVGIFAIAAPSEDEAEHLCATRNLWVMQLLQGRAGAFPSPEEALAYPYSDADRAQIKAISARSISGNPTVVRDKLASLAAAYGAEDLNILSITYDFAARVRSYELIAEAFRNAPA